MDMKITQKLTLLKKGVSECLYFTDNDRLVRDNYFNFNDKHIIIESSTMLKCKL